MGDEAQAEPVHVSTSPALVPLARVSGVAAVPLPVKGAADVTVGSAANQFEPFHLATWPDAVPFKRTPPSLMIAFCAVAYPPTKSRSRNVMSLLQYIACSYFVL